MNIRFISLVLISLVLTSCGARRNGGASAGNGGAAMAPVHVPYGKLAAFSKDYDGKVITTEAPFGGVSPYQREDGIVQITLIENGTVMSDVYVPKDKADIVLSIQPGQKLRIKATVGITERTVVDTGATLSTTRLDVLEISKRQ